MTEEINIKNTAEKTAHTGNFLLLDDDKFLLDMYSMKFVQEGYSVQACTSGWDAIEIVKGGFVPDAILFDITMPECDGFQFLEEIIKNHLADSAVKLALTNQNTDDEKKRMLELGVDQYLIKATLIPSEVVNIVNTALSGRRAA